ncbi:type III secretion protein (HrpB4) [Roseateles sp. YR242]|uniref:type III secretion protein HrpB4 n=1 Tax=Roseateles sp. YR242 TaxID=1855305 RepID=UPI0008B72D31|nr:type III secretion protein HrpB4 [Roseateles sp. YR242]SEK24887.1 type III secretion protein (HrpB4) [Roseateles sp. YR242]
MSAVLASRSAAEAAGPLPPRGDTTHMPGSHATDMPSGDTIARLAGWAVAFDAKLCGLAEDLDTSWRQALLGPWSFLDAMPPERAAVLWPRLWRDRLAHEGHWPALGRFDDPLTRLCLLPRGDLLQRLCTLALARRPGVLRCCIDRSVRAPLQRALGDTFSVLSTFSPQGRPVDAAQAAWSPVQWACVGFADWSAALAGDSRLITTLVRWSLPRQALDQVLDAAPVPAERPVAAALAALGQAEVTWPC